MLGLKLNHVSKRGHRWIVWVKEIPDHHNNKMLTELFTKIHIPWYAIPTRKSPTVESANITKIVFIFTSWWPDSQANHWAGIMVAHAAAVWMMNVIKVRIAVSIHGNIGESFTKSFFRAFYVNTTEKNPHELPKPTSQAFDLPIW